MFVIKATQKLPLSLGIKDKEGNPAEVQGVPVWKLSDPSLGDLQVAEDGKSATLLAGSPSTGTIEVACDADLGEGVTTVGAHLDISIVAGDAAVVTIDPGTAEEQ